MNHAEDLLAAADLLLACANPTDATRRRAVSTAYYAVFHLLVDAAVARLAVEDSPAANLVRRAPTHTHLKKLCADLLQQKNQKAPVLPPPEWRAAGFTGSVSKELGDLAGDVVALHAARETADYDLGTPLGPLDAERHVSVAHRVFATVRQAGTAAPRDEWALFLAHLLVGARRG